MIEKTEKQALLDIIKAFQLLKSEGNLPVHDDLTKRVEQLQEKKQTTYTYTKYIPPKR